MTDHVDLTVDPDGPDVALPAPARPPSDVAREELATQLVEEARAVGLALVGPEGLLASLTKRVLELGLESR